MTVFCDCCPRGFTGTVDECLEHVPLRNTPEARAQKRAQARALQVAWRVRHPTYNRDWKRKQRAGFA